MGTGLPWQNGNGSALVEWERVCSSGMGTGLSKLNSTHVSSNYIQLAKYGKTAQYPVSGVESFLNWASVFFSKLFQPRIAGCHRCTLQRVTDDRGQIRRGGDRGAGDWTRYGLAPYSVSMWQSDVCTSSLVLPEVMCVCNCLYIHFSFRLNYKFNQCLIV